MSAIKDRNVSPLHGKTRAGHLRASGRLGSWRTIDLLTTTFLGAAFGVAYWVWGFAYAAPAGALEAVFKPLSPLVYGPWLLAGVVGGLVVRRPGAALLCEVVAALVSMIAGTAWGWTTLLAGILQGIGAELVFAVFAYRVFTLAAAVLAGAMAAPLEAIYELVYYGYRAEWSLGYEATYLLSFMVSGAVIGLLGWLLVRSLALTGALGALPPGQELREARAV